MDKNEIQNWRLKFLIIIITLLVILIHYHTIALIIWILVSYISLIILYRKIVENKTIRKYLIAFQLIVFVCMIVFKVAKPLTEDSKKSNNEIVEQNFLSAFSNPFNYISNYGLKVIYPALVIQENNHDKTLLVSFTDIYNIHQTTIVNSNNHSRKYKKGEICLISKIIKSEKNYDTIFKILEKNITLDSCVFDFGDEIMTTNEVLIRIPQFKYFLQNYQDFQLFNNKYVIGYYLSTKTESTGRSSYNVVEYMYYNENEEKEIILCTPKGSFPGGHLVKVDSEPALIAPHKKSIIKSSLSKSDYEKYKYPVIIDKDGFTEIGNDSYVYAKYSPTVFLKNFGLKLAYLANVDSYTEKPLVWEVNVHFTDENRNNFNEKTYIRLPFEPQHKLIVYNQDNQCIAVDKIFQNDKYYEKFKHGYAFVFKDTILTKDELLKDIPEMEKYIQ